MATTTISIDMDNLLLDQLQRAAGEGLPEWITAACRTRLWADAARAAAQWERDHPDEAAAARAADAVRTVEAEAEREIAQAADDIARHRAGDAAEPTDADYARALRQVRDLLDKACRELDGTGPGQD